MYKEVKVMDQDPKDKTINTDQENQENSTPDIEKNSKPEENNESLKNDEAVEENQEKKISNEENDIAKKMVEFKEKLTEKEKEIEELKNLLLRTQADFDNFRKRKQKEIQEIHQYSGESFIIDILPVIDNFERALSSSQDEEDPFYKGVKMIYQQLLAVLQKHDVKEIEAAGKTFDPNYHEAIMQVSTDEYENDTVVEVLRKGYQYHSKVIRPSMVKVCKK